MQGGEEEGGRERGGKEKRGEREMGRGDQEKKDEGGKKGCARVVHENMPQTNQHHLLLLISD